MLLALIHLTKQGTLKKNQPSDRFAIKFPQQPFGFEICFSLYAPSFSRPTDSDHKKSDVVLSM